MTLKPYPIVPFQTGLETDRQAFLLPDDASTVMENCHVYQGKIERKEGCQYLGRLVQYMWNVVIGNTGASPFIGNILGAYAPAALGLSPGSVEITIGGLTYADNGSGIMSAGGLNTGTIDYKTGEFHLVHPVGVFAVTATKFEYYTGRPVMGLPTEEASTVNREELKAFDTSKANQFSNTLKRFVDISFNIAGTAIQWSGTDSDFFYTANYYTDTAGNKLFWATNNIASSNPAPGIIRDGIQIYNEFGWEGQDPAIDGVGGHLRGALILIPYRGRMVALNTLESGAGFGAATRIPNRARWCQNGLPYTNVIPGFDASNETWRSDIIGKGGFVDAPTSEAIVACGFYKDSLIVFFERSTWLLFYTGSAALPFAWQRINSQFGCESTHSVIGFDKGVFAVGNTAIITSDSVNVDRIDTKIPTTVFDFHNQSDGPKRVYGIRDFYYQFCYWALPTVPDQTINPADPIRYPNRVLVLNYEEGTWSTYDDSYTCFGYYQGITDSTWANIGLTWATAGTLTWTSGRSQADFPSIVGGNQQGFVLVMDRGVSNGTSLYVTGITQAQNAVVSSPQHNLRVGQFVKFTQVNGMTEINNLVGKIVKADAATFTIDIDTRTFTPFGNYGLLTVVSGFNLKTKRFNPFYQVGQMTRLTYADFYVDRTTAGAFTVNYLLDDADQDPEVSEIVETTNLHGPLTAVGKVWQRTYPSLIAQFVQLQLTLSDAQLRNPVTFQEVDPSKSQITIHAINLWQSPSGRLVY